MGGIAGEEETAETHRLDDEAAHAGNTFLQDGSVVKLPATIIGQAGAQLLPDAIVGPFANIFLGRALKIKAGETRGTHAMESETALVIGVNQLFGGRRGLGQNAEPAEGIGAIEDGESTGGNAGAADAVEAVASGDEITFELVARASVGEIDFRPGLGMSWRGRRREIVNAEVGNFKKQRSAGGEASVE